MKPIATILFNDLTSGEEGCVIVKAKQGMVELTLTLRRSGEAETFLPLPIAKQVLQAMQQAVSTAELSDN
jgi:hypothetical protein